MRTFVSRAIISVLKELIHLIHRLQRKERRMLFLDYQDRRPIYEQIVEKFRMLILSGAVEPSSKMPSVRQLARGIIHQSQYHPAGIYGTGAAGADLSGEGKRQFCYDSSRSGRSVWKKP